MYINEWFKYDYVNEAAVILIIARLILPSSYFDSRFFFMLEIMLTQSRSNKLYIQVVCYIYGLLKIIDRWLLNTNPLTYSVYRYRVMERGILNVNSEMREGLVYVERARGRERREREEEKGTEREREGRKETEKEKEGGKGSFWIKF